jgi:Flp pilus assembly CpaE family ATPase
VSELLEIVRVLLEAIDRAADLNKPGWRVLSLMVSPIVALIACYFSVRQRIEIKEQAKDLGILEERVNSSQERLGIEEKLLEAKDAELKQQAAEISSLQRDIALLTERSHELWKIRPAAPFPEMRTWQREPHAARIVAFGNLKGGVGKTTLASNFGAYAIRDLNLRTLLLTWTSRPRCRIS